MTPTLTQHPLPAPILSAILPMALPILASIAMMLLPAALAAQTPCATLTDPQQRLACYDAQHASATAEAAPEATADAPTDTAADTGTDASHALEDRPQTAPPAATPAAEVTREAAGQTARQPAAEPAPTHGAPTAAEAERAFGAEDLPAAADTPRKPDTLHSRIVGRFDGWAPGTVFELENGQQWRCAERTTASYRLSSPAVTIQRSWSGGYLMRVEGANRPVSVTRIR